jgi:hypothetical protein
MKTAKQENTMQPANLARTLAGATLGLLVAVTAGVARADAPKLDMDRVHDAYWQMKGSTSTDALQWFEKEVNKVYHGDDHVSIAARRDNDSGYPRTQVIGYLERDGAPGYNPRGDRTLFRFNQNGRLQGHRVPYQFTDGSGVVIRAGIRPVPAVSVHFGFYNPRAMFVAYYTPRARIAYLRTWRVGFRTSPVYVSWRSRFIARPAVRVRAGVVVAPRARIVVGTRVRAGVVVRPAVRVRARVVVARPAVRVRVRAPAATVRVKAKIARPSVSVKVKAKV